MTPLRYTGKNSAKASVAVVLFRYFPHGGLQRDAVGVATRLRDRGHAVTMLAGDWRGPRPDGIAVRTLGRRGWTNHGRNRRFAAAARVATAEGRFDCVVGFNRMPGLDIYYCADPCYRADALTRHGPLYRLTPRFRQMAAFERAVFAPAAGTDILLLSERERDRYAACYATPAARFHLVPPVIGRDRMRPDEAAAQARRAAVRAALGVAAQEFLLLQVGASLDTKGLDRTLTALAGLPAELCGRTRLVVAGAGDAAAARRLARRLGIGDRVRMLGPRDDVPDLLLGADLLVHPARRENTGQAILEAVVAGLPVLTTAGCGYSSHVERAGAGIVLPEPFDQAALTAALTAALAAMPASPRRAEWSRNGASYGRATDLYSGLDRAAALIERLVAARRAKTGRTPP